MMTENSFVPEQDRRCGFVALIGAPNVGKSTLLNQMVGAKVSIVSRKVQTTRSRITGIAMVGPAQIIFVDTPGIFVPQRRLDTAMVAAAWGGAEDADLVVLLIDAERGIDANTDKILTSLAESGRSAILAINKIDAVKKETLLRLTQKLSERGEFAEMFMISALTGDGVGDLKSWLAAHVLPGPWHYPEDQLSDISERLLASEITREKIYDRLHQELPYATTVETEEWKEKPDGSVRVSQVIYVQRKSQKPIVLGKGGRMVGEIGKASRLELEEFLGRRVHLFLFVKIREGWIDDPERYREMGLDFPTSAPSGKKG